MRLLGWLMLSAAIAACVPLTVSSHIQPGADFSRYRTYDWAPRDALPTGDPRLDNNPFLDSHVRASVERELAAKGYRREAENPDLLLHYHASVQQKVDICRTDAEAGYGKEDTYRTDAEAGYGYESAAVQYEEGTLALDVADARTKQIIWRGWGQSDVSGVINDQSRMEKRIVEVTREILKRFPLKDSQPAPHVSEKARGAFLT
ncbi:MAG: DUF4136 domain-containing protein [Gemmatimonadetes bacterium]|nr:DUF4136 domain-containing protein [Gemmatimonadota bacterium]